MRLKRQINFKNIVYRTKFTHF